MSRGHHRKARPAAWTVVALVVVVAAVGAFWFARERRHGTIPLPPTSGATMSRALPSPHVPAPTSRPTGPFPVAFHTATFVDRSRTVSAQHTSTGAPGPRVLRTSVWMPATRNGAPYPLIVFAHGFDVTPSTYDVLLRAWARAGYVVAAPAFPLTSPSAIGGVDEADMTNEPQDLRFLISRLTGHETPGWLSGLIDPSKVAVAGHSDGADVALAVAAAGCCRDPRVDAAVIMSGQEMPFFGRFFARPNPPILVMEGTADTVTSPGYSAAIYRNAGAPKFLLWLRGAEHLPPFAQAGRDEAAAQQVSVGFLDRYLKAIPARIPRPASAVATLRSDPGKR